MKKRFLSALLSLVPALTLLLAPVSAASKSISAIAAPKLTLDENKMLVLASGPERHGALHGGVRCV